MESNQLIISIGREFGSGGHVIAEGLAKKYNLPLYDENLLRSIATEKNVDANELKKYDEVPKARFFSRTVRGYSNSPEENIASMQFEYIKKKAKEGESFVIVGRCSETILKGNNGLISIFILGDLDKKIERIARRDNITYDEAESKIYKTDKKRKTYHNYYCTGKWGDSRNYDISVNSSKLGIEGTVEMLSEYIDRRRVTKKRG